MRAAILLLVACGSSTPPATPPPPPVIGTLVSSSQLSGTTQELRAKGLQVPLAQMPQIAAALSMPVSGTADVDISIDVPNGAASLVNGQARVTCTKCRIGDDRTKLLAPKAKDARARAFMGDGFDFSHIDFDRLDIDLEIANGRAELKKLAVTSPDLVVEASGHVELGSTIEASTISACIRFKPQPALQARDPKMFALISITGAPLGDDGMYSIELAGTLGDIKRLGKICH